MKKWTCRARAVWTARSVPRHSFHVWLVVQNRIPTRDRMLGWGLQVPSICLLCNRGDESRDHLYWDCDFSFGLWNLVAVRCRIIPTRQWEGSLDQMISLPPPTSTRSLTLLAWQSTMYWIWQERNQRLHVNQFRSIDSLFNQIDRHVRNKISSFRSTNPQRASEMMQQWLR